MKPLRRPLPIAEAYNALMSLVEQFIRDLGRYHSPPRVSKDGRLVVMRRQDDAAGRELAVEVTQLNGTDGGPWPDHPPKKICYSAGVEPRSRETYCR